MSDSLSYDAVKVLQQYFDVARSMGHHQDEKLQLLKPVSMIRDSQNYYLSCQIKAQYIGGIVLLLGNNLSIPTTAIYQDLLNNIKVPQDKLILTFTLIEGVIYRSPTASNLAQPFFIRINNLGQQQPYHFIVNSGQNDKGHSTHQVIGNKFPSKLDISYGHVIVDSSTQLGEYLEYNDDFILPSDTSITFLNQQAILITLRFLFKVTTLI